MKLFFWFCFAGVLYTYAGYPVCVALLARLRPKTWRQEKNLAEHTENVSIILAVHNGEHLIEGKIQDLLSLNATLVREVIIISDGSTDQTVVICRRVEDTRFRFIELRERCGKASAVAEGMKLATGGVLVFNDLRARIQPGALECLLENFADASVGCVGGELHLVLKDVDGTVSAVGGLYWRFERWLRSCESRFDSSAGVSGCFFAVRRDLAVLPPRGLLLDDVFQPMAIVRQGYRTVIDTRAVVTDTLPVTKDAEFSRKVRTLTGNYQLLSLAPWLLTKQNRIWWEFSSHKVLRLCVPFFLIGMLLSSAWLEAASPYFACLVVLQLVAWTLSALNIKTPVEPFNRVTSAGNALLMLNLAAIAALYKFLFHKGPLWQMWSKDMTARVK